MRRIFFIFIFAISGCVSNDLTRVEKIAPNNTILVVSTLSNTMPVVTVGTTIFQNEQFEIPVANWHIPQYAESVVIDYLTPAYHATTDARLRAVIAPPKNDFFTGYPSALSNQQVFDIAKEHQADYILVISAVEFQDAYFGTNQFFEGLGVYQRTFLGSEKIIQFAQVGLNLFDAHTGEFVATNGTVGHNGGDSVWISHQALNCDLIDSQGELTADNKQLIKATNEALVSKIVERSLKYMAFDISATLHAQNP